MAQDAASGTFVLFAMAFLIGHGRLKDLLQAENLKFTTLHQG
jgi:hypothetical protein